MASSALYLGYVEDDESVEMILRKFQKLEELQRVKGGGKAGTAGEGGDSGPAGEEEGLSLEEQEELFRETSYFSVASVAEAEEEERLWASLFDDSVEPEEEYDEEEEEEGTRRRRRKRAATASGREGKEPRPPKLPSKDKTATRVTTVVADRNNQYVTAVKRVRVVNRNALDIDRLGVPKKTEIIQPYTPAPILSPEVAPHVQGVDTAEAAAAPADAAPVVDAAPVDAAADAPVIDGAAAGEIVLDDANFPKFGFQAVVLNPLWQPEGVAERLPGHIVPADLPRLNLSAKVIPTGFVLIWVEKHVLSATLLTLETMGFYYVENVCWVKMLANNKMVQQPGSLLGTAKATLLLCRKSYSLGKHVPIEIRHQRSPDVVFDIVKEVDGREGKPHEFVYEMVETLLPYARYNEKRGRGCMLELWAPRGAQRAGWTMVSQAPPAS